MNDSPAIEAHDLTKVYGSGNTEVVAMRNASMTVRRGEVVARIDAVAIRAEQLRPV